LFDTEIDSNSTKFFSIGQALHHILFSLILRPRLE
jgi:hypothetical protein